MQLPHKFHIFPQCIEATSKLVACLRPSLIVKLVGKTQLCDGIWCDPEPAGSDWLPWVVVSTAQVFGWNLIMHQTRASDCSNESSPYHSHSHFLFPFPFPGCICAKASSATCHCLSAVAVPNDSSLCFGFCFCSSFWFWFRFRWMVVELRCSCCSCLQCGVLVPFPFPFSLLAQMCATAAYLKKKKKKRRGTRRVWRNRGSMSCHSPLLLFRVLLCHWRGGHRSARVQSSQLLLIKRACQRQDTDTCGIHCEDRAQQEKLEPLCFTYD